LCISEPHITDIPQNVGCECETSHHDDDDDYANDDGNNNTNNNNNNGRGRIFQFVK
jgi:hypothetical protein